MDDILINKNQTVKRCLERINEEYQKLNLKIVEAIIENEIEEIKDFSQNMLQPLSRVQPETDSCRYTDARA